MRYINPRYLLTYFYNLFRVSFFRLVSLQYLLNGFFFRFSSNSFFSQISFSVLTVFIHCLAFAMIYAYVICLYALLLHISLNYFGFWISSYCKFSNFPVHFLYQLDTLHGLDATYRLLKTSAYLSCL